MKKRANKQHDFKHKLLTGIVIGSLILGGVPIAAFAVSGNQVAADGTYTGTATATVTKRNAYNPSVSLTVNGGKITAVTVNPNTTNEDNLEYFADALNGIKKQLLGKDATIDNINSVDAVSEATISSNAIQNSLSRALGSAPEKQEETPKTAYTVSFNGNATTGVPAAVITDSSGKVTLPTEVPTKRGYRFKGWSTSQTADDAEYKAGQTITVSADTTLYAVWQKQITYKIMLRENNAVGKKNDRIDKVVDEDSSKDQSKASITIPESTIQKVTVPKGKMLIGWTETKEGTTVDYKLGDTITVDANDMMELYPVFADKSSWNYTVKFDTNGGEPLYKYTDSKITGQANVGSDATVEFAALPYRAGFTFKGWNTEQDGSGTNYGTSGNITIKSNESTVTLYAIWKTNRRAAFCVYNADEGKYVVANDGSDQVVVDFEGDNATLSTKGHTATEFTKDGKTYQFIGWKLGKSQDYTNNIATQKDCDPGGTLSISLNDYKSKSSLISVYAVYEAQPTEVNYKINFDANGGKINYINNKLYTSTTSDASWTSTGLPGGGNLTAPDGKSFVEWNTQADGKGTAYKYNDTVTLTSDNPEITLYAIYQESRTIAFFKFDPDNKWTLGAGGYVGTGENIDQTFSNGEATFSTEGYTADDFTKDGKTYQFIGWKLGKTQNQMTTIRTEKDCDVNGKLTAKLSDYDDDDMIYVYAVYQEKTNKPDEPVTPDKPNQPSQPTKPTTPTNPTKDNTNPNINTNTNGKQANAQTVKLTVQKTPAAQTQAVSQQQTGVPKTGDTAQAGVFAGMFAAAAAGTAAMVYKRKKEEA